MHELVTLAFHGPRPEGLTVRHLDGNPANNTPENLLWGSWLEQAQDRARHGTQLRGSKCHNAQFTEPEVAEIKRRLAAGARASDLAKELRASARAISKISRGETWRHVAQGAAA